MGVDVFLSGVTVPRVNFVTGTEVGLAPVPSLGRCGVGQTNAPTGGVRLPAGSLPLFGYGPGGISSGPVRHRTRFGLVVRREEAGPNPMG